MPYKSQKIKIAGTKFDRRVKLTTKQRIEILANEFNLSQRELGLKYKVSKSLIAIIQRPERLDRIKECRAARGGSKIYYNKDKQREAIKEHRRYKEELAADRKLKAKKKKKPR